MSFFDILYILFIWPIRILTEFFFIAFNVAFNNAGLSIIFLSIVINSLLLPIYSVADAWQKEERDLQKRMSKKIADIKAVFKGDERQMITNTYYRQMGYSTFNALKSSMGLLLQIPFFIAAYQFLSHTPTLDGASFFIFKNLGTPDGLLRAGSLSINILPILMTAVNICSSLVYTTDLGRRERIQLLTISLVFLVLLYNSPSGLVLYWTTNNIFSLGKNIATARLKHPARALQILSVICAIFLICISLSGIAPIKRLYKYALAAAGVLVIAAPFAWKALTALGKKSKSSEKENTILFFSSCAVMCILLGLLVPAQVIAASPVEFETPWLDIFRTFLQSIAASVLIPLLIWSFATRMVRKIIAPVFSGLCILGLVCFFVLSTSYGTMTRGFIFENPHRIRIAFSIGINVLAFFAAILIPCLFIILNKYRVLATLFQAACLAILVTGIVNLVSIRTELQETTGTEAEGSGAEGLFKYTATGNNTALIFLDKGISIAMYNALQEMPELNQKLDGFTWYPKTISFGDVTIIGVPSFMGGYEYSPWKINAREDELLVDKINEAVTLLPRIFGEAGYRVAISDPSLANLRWIPDISIYDDIENVTARNLKGYYTHRFKNEFPDTNEKIIESFDFDILFRYGVFRIALPVLRYGVYYNGGWWRDGRSNSYERAVAVFPNLYYLKDLCSVDNGTDTLNIFMNETTHEGGSYNSDLIPVSGQIQYSEEEIEKFGSAGNASYMYTFLAAMKSITTWIDYLKEMNIYDNTRIIIVSDHGGNFPNSLFGDERMERYNPLLMVKERHAHGPLAISDEFMTNADVPAIAARDIPNPVNPYLGIPVNSQEKEGPLFIYDAPGSQNRHGPVKFKLERAKPLLDRDIFRSSSWGRWEDVKND
ncbi:membrane protein insertase YidC [Treponema sp. OttesenSCG-928-L16]|nr:membrane protein insertase YidC [Treponema sp. OttesenSCG-928-L16]